MANAVLKTRLIKIGNSQGIRIPKPILEQIGATDELELEVQDDELIVRSLKAPREGWAERFHEMAEMAERGDDVLLDGEPLVLTEWEETEWEWE
jgi:antitoxin MazE